MELKAENVKNIRSLAVCKEFLRQAIEQNDQLKSDYEEACGRLRLATAHKPQPCNMVVRKPCSAGGMRMQVRDMPAS